MSRDDLVAKARSLGVLRPELMTRVELSDEILRRSESDPAVQRKARGFLGVARDLVASVVETGLNLSDAAALIRGDRFDLSAKGPPPVATVTLAEIYAAQGHVERALHMLEEVLAGEPEHAPARALFERLSAAQAPPVSAAEAPPREDVDSSSFPPTTAEPAEAAVAPESLEEAEDDASTQASPKPVDAWQASEGAARSSQASPERTESAPEPAESPPEPAQALPEIAAPSAVLEIAKAEPQPTPVAAPRVAKAKPSLLVLRTRRPHPLVCWDLEELKSPDPEARLEIECLGFFVGSTGPERREVVLPVAEPKGSAVLSAFDGRTVVRVALGYRLSGAFVPLAIASEFSVQSEVIHVRFRPPLVGETAPTPVERALVAEFVA